MAREDSKEIKESSNFINDIIEKDLETGAYSRVQTRFPPEPNGYLHIGHAKAICINFGAKEKFGGICNLRFDDTNPTKEDTEYVDAIAEDIKWLGFDWDNAYFASDYFDYLFECAIKLIKRERHSYVTLLPKNSANTEAHSLSRAKKALTETEALRKTLIFSREWQTENFPKVQECLEQK